MLFDEIPRDSLAPARYGESEYGYLNTSARPEAERVRRILDEWFSKYPSTSQAELKARMVANLHSPFFELLIHQLLSLFGGEIELHPQVPESGSHPDFLYKNVEETTFVEAVVADGMAARERSARIRYDGFLDAVNSLETPDYFLSADVRQVSDKSPSGRHIRHFLRQYLLSLRVGMVQARRDNSRSLPSRRYCYDGWDVLFTAFPKSQKAQGKEGIRPLGVVTMNLHWIDADSLRECLREKARKYRNLPHPYIIAINVVADVFEESDMLDSLFGIAKPGGLWRSSGGPRYTRVSGVLVCRVRSPWSLASATATLYINPWAQKAYEGVLCSLPRRIVQDGHLVSKEGISLRDLFGISKSWPEE